MRRLFACVLLATSAFAQQRLSLDGTWTIAAETGANAPPATAREIEVPAAFETALGTDFDGVACYRRTLPTAPHWRGATVRVEFAAVATQARVRCNGIDVGEHLGGWTPFRVDVTAALRFDGSDELEVRVDEKVGHNTQGFLPIVQPHFGGIWQSVTLCIDRDAVVDRLAWFTFGRLMDPATRQGQLTARIPLLATATSTAARVRLDLLDGSRVLATTSASPADAAQGLALDVASVRPWSVATPHCYRARASVLDAVGTVLDEVERRVAFRSLQTRGTTILWNGEPLQVRGVLHWGYSPPHLAPPSDPQTWRRQLEDFRSLGFNTLKCCLFVPPACVYDLCDELGMLCWQEYPTWHPRMDQAHKQELLAEYAEFHAHDGSHASVAFRSITCETGHGADLDVVKALFAACHAAVPDTLVVDDSSWIGWQRVADFWDEHPYGNNRWWPGRLADFARHLEQHGEKPLLLGECIAADTWVDRARWAREYPHELPWWRPDCLADQGRFESWLVGQFGAETLATLVPAALATGMATRRYQIERLRRTLPAAGYVVSVARDFGKARMGLYDDFDRLKWDASEWSWQRDTMLCLATDQRAFVTGDGDVALSVQRVQGANPPGPPVQLPPLPRVDAPTRHRVHADLEGTTADWDVWLLPAFDAAAPPEVRIADHLDVDLLDALERGGRALLRVGGAKHCLRSEPLWYLRGAPWAPPHPVHARLPLPMLLDLQQFDLDGGRVIPWQPLLDQVDPILAFWETHDIAEVRAHLLAGDLRIGQGRLLVSAFDRDSAAGRYVERELLQHLAHGPAPRRELSAANLQTLRLLLAERTLPLPTWRFCTDPDDRGFAAGYQLPSHDAGTPPWRDLAAGSHWENQAKDLEHYTGVAWYRIDLDVPDDWPTTAARAVFEGVDDSFEFWLDGESLARRGDPATGVTVWLEPQVVELDRRLTPGRHTLALRVVDHAGAGGLWKPAYLTTGPTGPARSLLQ